jgi:D-alanyl-D-alanine carboxypeptidase (penicillin-binding protein 5/6)
MLKKEFMLTHLLHPPKKRDNSTMDRRKIVYYNQRTSLSGTRRTYSKKKKNTAASKILLAVAFFAIIAIAETALSKPKSAPSQVLAEQVASAEQMQPARIDSPLQEVAFPELGQSAIGTLEEGVIKVTPNEKQSPIASITKIVTALIILEKHPLQLGEKGDTITLTEKDLQYFNDYYAKLGTVTTVVPGQSMTQYEALQAILLPSSNNMADTMVDHYFSSREDYLSYANTFLASHGLHQTIVADASGFSPESKSTPSDLIKLGQLALKNPVIKEIVAQKSATIAVGGDIPNYNSLINEPDVIGIKPGATDEAGYCLLFAAVFPDKAGTTHTLIAVTMGHIDRPEYIEAAKRMLEASREAYLD